MELVGPTNGYRSFKGGILTFNMIERLNWQRYIEVHQIFFCFSSPRKLVYVSREFQASEGGDSANIQAVAE